MFPPWLLARACQPLSIKKQIVDISGFVGPTVSFYCNYSTLLLLCESSHRWYIINELSCVPIKLDSQKQTAGWIGPRATVCHSCSNKYVQACWCGITTWIQPAWVLTLLFHTLLTINATFLPTLPMCCVFSGICDFTFAVLFLESLPSSICLWNIYLTKPLALKASQLLPHPCPQRLTSPSFCCLCTCFHY